MKVIDYIYIKGMFAHKDVRIDFAEGKNYIVGPIGSGKTELIQAIAFAFFGTVALRDKATSYKNIFVELAFNFKNERFLIRRKINDASLLMFDNTSLDYLEIVNSTSVVNQKIISLLGYNYDIFLLSNLCQQKKLSYFSDLTPAKRLQYIDKISGIEESKELLKYLNSRRKTLKDNINLLKDVTIKPNLSPDIDLEFNYESHIHNLNNRLQNITTLYTTYNDLSIVANEHLVKPSLQLREDEQPFAYLTEQQINEANRYITTLNELDFNVAVLQNKLGDIPKLSSKLKRLSLEEVEQHLHNINLNNLQKISNNVKINCPSCHEEHDLNSLLKLSECSSTEFLIKDLYNVQDFLKNDYARIERELRIALKEAEEIFSQTYDNEPIKGLHKFKDVTQLQNYVKRVNHLTTSFDKQMAEYLIKSEEQKTLKDEVLLIKQQIDEGIKTQEEDLALRDLYVKQNIERIHFLERFALYEEAYVKLTNFQIELDLVTNLIKEVSTISSTIKNQTIPLLNYHASALISIITKGKLSSIEITEDYDLIIDGIKISLRSGGESDLASLSFRLSLGQSLITGMLPLFIGDEIDSAGGEADSDDITQALDIISERGFQLILITHKNTNNIINSNIIQL